MASRRSQLQEQTHHHRPPSLHPPPLPPNLQRREVGVKGGGGEGAEKVQLGLQVTNRITLVPNLRHYTAPFFGFVGQLHRKRDVLLQRCGLNGGFVLFIVLQSYDRLQKALQPIQTSRRKRGTEPGASTGPGSGWLGQRRKILHRANRERLAGGSGADKA